MRPFILVMLALSVAQAAPEAVLERTDTLQAALRAGHQAIKDKDWGTAHAAFLRAAEAKQTDSALWRQAGDLAHHIDDADVANAAWKRALELDPDNLALMSRAAVGATLIGDFGLSAARHLAIVDRASGHHYEFEIRHRHLVAGSEAAALAGDLTTAENSAVLALRMKGTRAHQVAARLALAYAHLQARDNDEAEGAYLDVLEMEPNNTIALNNLGNLHYLRGDFSEARDHFEAILELYEASDHTVSIAYVNLGELFQLEGRYEDAEWLYAQAAKTFPSGAWSHFGLGALADLNGAYNRALNHTIDGWRRDQSRLTRLNSVFLRAEWAWQRAALIAEVEGDYTRAEKLWMQVAHGTVKALHRSAGDHLTALESTE